MRWVKAHICGTNSKEFENREWFRDYLRFVDWDKSGALPDALVNSRDQPLEVELGVEYAQWIIETPELLDIIYRRFIFCEYDNELEGNLLHFSAIYFMRKSRISGNEGFLGTC